MSSFDSPHIDFETRRIRDRARKVGLFLFTVGLHSRHFELSENLNLLSKCAIAAGLVVVTMPLVSDIQDYRKIGKRWDDDDDWDDDWWNDDDFPPNTPNDPGGLNIDWVAEIEDYANNKESLSV